MTGVAAIIGTIIMMLSISAVMTAIAVVNVTIGDTNIPLGHAGFGSNDESARNFARAEQIARLIAAAPDLLDTLGAVMMTINTPEVPDAALARGRAQLLLAELGHGTHKGEQGQEEIER